MDKPFLPTRTRFKRPTNKLKWGKGEPRREAILRWGAQLGSLPQCWMGNFFSPMPLSAISKEERVAMLQTQWSRLCSFLGIWLSSEA